MVCITVSDLNSTEALLSKDPKRGQRRGQGNQGDDTQNHPPPQCQWCCNFNYRLRCPENPKAQEDEETSVGFKNDKAELVTGRKGVKERREKIVG